MNNSNNTNCTGVNSAGNPYFNPLGQILTVAENCCQKQQESSNQSSSHNNHHQPCIRSRDANQQQQVSSASSSAPVPNNMMAAAVGVALFQRHFANGELYPTFFERYVVGRSSLEVLKTLRCDSFRNHVEKAGTQAIDKKLTTRSDLSDSDKRNEKSSQVGVLKTIVKEKTSAELVSILRGEIHAEIAKRFILSASELRDAFLDCYGRGYLCCVCGQFLFENKESMKNHTCPKILNCSLLEADPAASEKKLKEILAPAPGSVTAALSEDAAATSCTRQDDDDPKTFVPAAPFYFVAVTCAPVRVEGHASPPFHVVAPELRFVLDHDPKPQSKCLGFQMITEAMINSSSPCGRGNDNTMMMMMKNNMNDGCEKPDRKASFRRCLEEALKNALGAVGVDPAACIIVLSHISVFDECAGSPTPYFVDAHVFDATAVHIGRDDAELAKFLAISANDDDDDADGKKKNRHDQEQQESSSPPLKILTRGAADAFALLQGFLWKVRIKKPNLFTTLFAALAALDANIDANLVAVLENHRHKNDAEVANGHMDPKFRDRLNRFATYLIDGFKKKDASAVPAVAAATAGTHSVPRTGSRAGSNASALPPPSSVAAAASSSSNPAGRFAVPCTFLGFHTAFLGSVLLLALCRDNNANNGTATGVGAGAGAAGQQQHHQGDDQLVGDIVLFHHVFGDLLDIAVGLGCYKSEAELNNNSTTADSPSPQLGAWNLMKCLYEAHEEAKCFLKNAKDQTTTTTTTVNLLHKSSRFGNISVAADTFKTAVEGLISALGDVLKTPSPASGSSATDAAGPVSSPGVPRSVADAAAAHAMWTAASYGGPSSPLDHVPQRGLLPDLLGSLVSDTSYAIAVSNSSSNNNDTAPFAKLCTLLASRPLTSCGSKLMADVTAFLTHRGFILKNSRYNSHFQVGGGGGGNNSTNTMLGLSALRAYAIGGIPSRADADASTNNNNNNAASSSPPGDLFEEFLKNQKNK